MKGNVTIVAYEVGATKVTIEYLGHYHNARKAFAEVYIEMVTATPLGVTTNPHLKMTVDDRSPIYVTNPDGSPLMESFQETVTVYDENGVASQQTVTSQRQRTITHYAKFAWELWDKRNPNTIPLETSVTEGILRKMGLLPDLSFTASPEWLETQTP